jgi:hypothetical protein
MRKPIDEKTHFGIHSVVKALMIAASGWRSAEGQARATSRRDFV